MRVRATDLGYYGDRRQRPGSVFTLSNPAHFSEKWMEALDGKKPAKRGANSGAGAKAAQNVQAPEAPPAETDLYPEDPAETGATGDQEVI